MTEITTNLLYWIMVGGLQMKITGEIAYRVFIAFIIVSGLAFAGMYISMIPQVRFAGGIPGEVLQAVAF